ncbi:DNA cytosine methyltransferase [Streptomyces griseoluteus]
MDVYDAEVVWHSQYEPPDKNGKEDKNQYAARILARHWPDVPNLGDITKVDWQAVIDEHGPIDILTGGFPCQDVSSAGRRVGLNPGTRSGLWNHMAHAVSVLQPKLVVIENVEGLLSAPAASDLEPCPYCVGDGHAQPVLRACGAVLGDLASLGLNAEWGRYGADEVGAPHRRRRIIIRAWPAALHPGGLGRRDGSRVLSGLGAAGRDAAAVQDTDIEPRDERRLTAPGQAEGGRARAHAGGRGGAPAADAQGAGLQGLRPEPARRGPERGRATSADTDGGRCEGHQERDSGPEDGQPEREPGVDPIGRGVRRAPVEPACPTCLCLVSDHDTDGLCAGCLHCTDPELGQPGLCPDDCPVCADEAPADTDSVGGREAVLDLRPGQPDLDWGAYEPAIRRWEAVLGRPAPWPTDALGRLSPVFTEWLMGLPDGWVTDTPGLTRPAMLRALGNGVVRQQAAYALRDLHQRAVADTAAAA